MKTLTRHPVEDHARVSALLEAETVAKSGSLLPIVREVLRKREQILMLTRQHQTPFYAFDSVALQNSIDQFASTVLVTIPDAFAYYAMKANPHPLVVGQVIDNQFGVDASSLRELQQALDSGATHILLSGPGKDTASLSLALQHRDRVIVHLDSFSELQKMGDLAGHHQQTIRVGVRIYTSVHGIWTKFGIPLTDLGRFYHAAAAYPYLQLQGIQMHSSWNTSARPYELIIREMAMYFKKHLSREQLSSIKFIDLGGGFLPYRAEGYYPQCTPHGKVIQTANQFFGATTEFASKYFISESVPLAHYATRIAQAIKTYFQPLVECRYFFEPGRIVCNDAMFMVLTLVDKKTPRFGIVDGGINAIGFERFETDYFPLVDLTHPSERERQFTMYGSLCTPHDLWGYYCYSSEMHEGDIIVVPNQGAYTYSLAQNFIKPIPDVRELW